jgi:chromosome segregation ATPase
MDEPKTLYLSDVSIEGFKSFSEPTAMHFEPGIGVIIGNNGVGKSNILDAMVWALGENDTGRLRCRGKEELFFFGSKTYPPASRIRVQLVFKEGPEKDSPQVGLVREVTRSGQELYSVDDRFCDVREYASTLDRLGLGGVLSTIIRQEQINDFLFLSPWERYDWIKGLWGDNPSSDLSTRLTSETDPLFRSYLKNLMPQGDGEIRLVHEGDRIGAEIEVSLSGDRRRKAHQLSGGEKSVTSLAMKLALFSRMESPLWLLDEVEPSLDYTNHKSMQGFLKMIARTRQLVMITHLRTTIELANTLHGVRTRMDGSSFMKFYFLMDERLLRLYKCC